MALSAIGRAALVAREALKTRAYKDSVGVWTIGVGHTSMAGPPTVTPGLVITQDEALAIFDRDLVQYEQAVDKAVTVPLAEHERDALISICYNIGAGAFRRSTFVKRLNAGDRTAAATAIMSWTKPKAVTSRRRGERDQFLTPYAVALPKARSDDARPVRVTGATPSAAAPARRKPASERMAVDGPVTAPQPELAILRAPAVETVSAPTRAEVKADLPFWARWFAPKARTPAVDRPGLKLGGDPVLYDVQVQLRDRAYYTRWKPDGFDGPVTRDAVAAARKDAGLGDGGIDDAFRAALPALGNRQVPVEKATASLREAAALRPELFSPTKWLATAGLGSLGLGTADGTGLLDQLQDTTARVGEVTGSVQSAIATVSGVVGFIAEHRSIVLILVGGLVLLQAVRYALDAWIKVRQAFF